MSAPPVALTIAGSDNSAGAGAQADLKTFTAHGVYGLTALTCIVAEIPGRVSAIQAADPDIVRAQIELSLGAYPVAAIKTGMLRSQAIIELVADVYASQTSKPLLVVDPVMVATSGATLLEPGAAAAYQTRLFPLAALVTPNLDEARALLPGREIAGPGALRNAGLELCALHGAAFLMKGGHFGGNIAIDWLCFPNGHTVELRAPFTRGISTHGTGCTYSAAVAAGLALGHGLEAAVTQAKTYISAAIGQFFRWQPHGAAIDALNHNPSR